MSKSGTIVGLTGTVWARGADGSLRQLSVGDDVAANETLILAAGATISVNYSSGSVADGDISAEVVTYTGPEDGGYSIVPPNQESASAAPPELVRMVTEDFAIDDGSASRSSQPGRVGDGYRFVEVVRIEEDLETDAIAPLSLGRVEEVVRPMTIDWGDPAEEEIEWPESSGQGEQLPTNRAPEAAPETQVIQEDEIATGNVLENDTDPENSPLAVTQFEVNGQVHLAGQTVTIPEIGTVVIGTDGSYSFTPVADWHGVVPTITYTVSDGRGGIATSTLDITVEPIADIVPDAITTHAGDPVIVNVLENDTFENGDAKVTAVTQGEHGTVAINPDGTITYTPNAGYVGPDSYTYTVTSGGVTETTTVTLDVTNTAPVASPEVETTPEDTPLSGNVLDNENDADSDPLTVVQFEVGGQVYLAGQTATIPGVGTLMIDANGAYTFTPGENWNGTVPTVTYTVSDGNQGGTATSTLDISVTPVNDAPMAGGLPERADLDADVITGVDVKVGFSDVEGDTLTYSATGLPPGLTLDPVTGIISGTIDGSASQSSTAGDPAGVYTVVVTADDGHGGTVEQSFTWTVANPGPAAEDDTNTTNEHTPLVVSAAEGVLGNDSDPDGETLVVSAVNGIVANVGTPVTGTSGGLFALNADGSYDFDPNGQFDDLAAGETRTTTITYTVSDGEGGTDTATLEVTVTGVNDAPVTVGTLPGQSSEDADAVTSVDITSAFTDVDASDTLTYTATGLPAGLTLDPATGIISGTIDNSASQSSTTGDPAGVYTVVVTADDGHGGTVTQSFTWTVTNPGPEARADQGSITEDGPDLVVSAANGVIGSGAAPAGADADPDGDALAVTHVVAGTATDLSDFPGTANAGTQIVGMYGTLTLNADGSYTYVLDNANPIVNALDAASAPLSDVFSYAISDGEGGTSFTTLTIAITGNDDGIPSIAAADDNGLDAGQLTVYEAGLTADGPTGDNAVASGTINISAGNGLANITIGGTTLSLAQLEAITAGAPIEIDTPQGKLTLTGYVSSGEIGGVSTGGQLSYTYTLEDTVNNPDAASSNSIENISLSVEDAAGVERTSTLGVNIVDDAPSSGTPTSATVDEANLAAGTDPDTAALTQTGTLDIRTGADDASVTTVFDAAQTAPDGLTSNGVAVVYVVSSDGHTLTATAGPGGPEVFTVTLTNPGTPTAGYSFVLSGPLDHGASNIDLSFAFTVTDADGDKDTSNFQVSVVDDGPVAVDQSGVSLAEGGVVVGSASGGTNLLGNDTAGADGSAKVVSITYTNEAGNSATAAVPTEGVTVDTRYGSLTVNPDGTWSYTSDATENNLAAVSESFDYTIADHDGSTSSATQPLTITDTGPSAAAVAVSLDEQDIPGEGSAGSSTNSVTEDLAITKGGDAISDVVFTASTVSDLEAENLTSGGTALEYTLSPDGHTLTATAGTGGPVVFTLTLNNPTDGTGASQSVTMTLTGKLDHATATGENSLSIPVGYTVHDTDSSTTANLNLTVVDDVPTAQADTSVSVQEGGQTVTGASLLANDVQGADGARVYQVRFINEAGNETTAAVAAGPSGSTYDTIHGSLTVRQDGTWSFTSDPATATGTSVNHPKPAGDLSVDDIFEYNLIDGDGDVSGWASQTVTVNDTAPSIGTPASSTVDEANLASGTAPDTPALTKTGTLAITKGADGIDVTFAGSQAALEDLNLTSGGTALVYTVSPDGYTLTATAGPGGSVVFVATITDPTLDSAGYSFVLSRPLDHTNGDEIQLPIAYGVADGDGDTDSANVIVTVVDDQPQTTRAFSLDEDSTGITFNTSADASPSNLTASDPDYGTVTVNANGTVTYVPDPGFSGTDTFTYTTTADNGSTMATTVTVTVNPISDAPQVTVDAATVQTNEDEAVALGLNAPVVTDAIDRSGAGAGDNPELLGEITLTGIPAGAALLDALGNVVFTSTGAPITIQLSDGTHISGLSTNLTMTSAEYQALRILPPDESHANFTVTVTVTSYEVGDDDAQLADVPGATSTTTVTVNVKAVTDPIELSLVDGSDTDTLASDHTFAEDTSFDLSELLSVSFGNTDGNAVTDVDGSEVRWFEISGLPIGTTVNGVTVTAENPVITVQAPDMSTSATGLPTMTITPPANFSGDVTITVTLKAQDGDADGIGGGATTDVEVQDSVTLDLHITPVGGDITASGVTTVEDTSIDFLSGITVTDDGSDGSEIITQVVFDVPAGWTFVEPGVTTGYTLSQDGTTYTIALDAGLTEEQREAVLGGFTIKPPSNSSADHTFNVEVTTTDTVSIDSGTVTDTTVKTLPIKVTVTPVAETVGGDSNADTISDATMTGNHSYTTAGTEDAWFTLGTEGGFNLKSGWSDQDGDEQIFARLTPELLSGDGGANNAIGSQFRYSTNGVTTEEGGAWEVVTYTGSPVDIPVQYLDTLQFKAPGNLSGSFKIKVETYTVDTDPDTGATNTKVSGSAELSNLIVNPAADEVTVALNARVTGDEDTAIPLDIRPTSSDPSETFTVTISSIPTGAQLYYDGVLQTVTAGSVTIANFDSGKPLTLQPPLNSNDDFTLNVSAHSVDGSDISDSQNLTVTVSLKGVADVVTITPVDATYSEAALDAGSDQVLLKELMTTSLYDSDGSEVLTLRITGLPEGFSLSEGTMLVSGTGGERVWVLTQQQLDTAVVRVPANFSGSQTFTVTPVTTENDGNSRTGAAQTVKVTVTPSTDATVTTSATLDEDALTPLNLGIAHQNGDTDETLTTVWIAVGDADSTNFTLYLGTTKLSEAGLTPVTVDGQSYYVLTGTQITQLAAKGASNLDGPLGSFNFKYEITDAHYGATPAGASTKTVYDGTFTLTANPVTDPVDVSITDIAGGAGTTVVSDGVADDDAVPDTAALTAGDTVTVTLNIAKLPDAGSAGGTADTDGSEKVIRVVIEGVPDGVSVQGGEYNGDGTWILIYDGPGALPINSSGGISLPVHFEVSAFAGDLNNVPITIQVQTQDRGDQASGTTIVSDTVTWHLTTNFPPGDGDIPAHIVEWSYNGAHASEDTAFSLSDVITAEVSVADPNAANTFTVSLAEVPPDTVITGMTMTWVNGQEVWTASVTVAAGGDVNAALQNLLQTITVTPPANSNENNGAGAFNFDASLTVSVPSGNNRKAIIDEMTVPVDPVTDAGVISISAASIDEGIESIPVTITVSNDADGAFGQIVDGKLYVKVDTAGSTNGLENGTLEYNGAALATELVDGVQYYVISGVTAGAPLTLTYTPNTSTAGQVSFSALVKTQESNSNDVLTGIGSGTAQVVMINNGVTVSSAPSSGAESTPVPITGLVVALVDSDGSESIKSILLSNVPNGFLVYVGASAGTAALASNAGGDNTWVISNPDGSLPAYVAIVPPEHWSGTLDDLTVMVESGESSFSDGRIQSFELGDITINPVADGIELTATNTFGPENQIISLNLNASMADPADASEAGAPDANQELTTLKLTGLGAFASFFVGGTEKIAGVSYDAGTDTYTLTGLTQADLDQLGFLQARNALTDQDAGSSGVQIRAEAFTTDGSSTSASDTVYMTVNSSAQLATSADDTLLWTGGTIDAKAGTDTVHLRKGEILSGSALDSGLSNVEVLDLNDNDVTSLSAADVLGIAGDGATLTILGGAEDSITLGEGWTSAAPQTIGGIDYAIYTGNVSGTDVQLQIQNGIPVD